MTVGPPINLEQMEQDAKENRENPSDLTKVEKAMASALETEAHIDALEEDLRTANKKLKQIMEVTLPDFMNEVGLTTVGTKDGAQVNLGTSGYGSLNYAPDLGEAVDYLEKNGMKGGVLTEVTVKFTADEEEQAKKMAAEIQRMTNKAVDVKRAINPQTLKAFVLRQVAEDTTFDGAKVGITLFSTAKFTKRPS